MYSVTAWRLRNSTAPDSVAGTGRRVSWRMQSNLLYPWVGKHKQTSHCPSCLPWGDQSPQCSPWPSFRSLMEVLAGGLLRVSPYGLLVSTSQVLIAQIVVGSLLKRTFRAAVDKVIRVLPLDGSVIGVALICVGVVAGSAGEFMGVGPSLTSAIACIHAAEDCWDSVARAFRLSAKIAHRQH